MGGHIDPVGNFIIGRFCRYLLHAWFGHGFGRHQSNCHCYDPHQLGWDDVLVSHIRTTLSTFSLKQARKGFRPISAIKIFLGIL